MGFEVEGARFLTGVEEGGGCGATGVLVVSAREADGDDCSGGEGELPYFEAEFAREEGEEMEGC